MRKSPSIFSDVENLYINPLTSLMKNWHRFLLFGLNFKGWPRCGDFVRLLKISRFFVVAVKVYNLPIGKQLKQSVKVFHNLMLYRLLHSS